MRLAHGQPTVPEPLLEPVWENDRRHVMKDLAAFLLDRHLRRLGAMRNPIELRLARLLARLQERSGYLELGFARLSDYVIERLGISVRRMQALVQLDGRIGNLPLTSAAFARGRVSSSQLRLLLRVTTPETEAAWLEKAARLNVRLLEREVAAASATPPAGGDPAQQAGLAAQSSDDPSQAAVGPRRSDTHVPDDEDEPGRPVSFECPDLVRAQWEWAVEICRRASGSTEPLWRCAEYIAADFLSGVPNLPARLAGAAGGQADGGRVDGAFGPAVPSSAECRGPAPAPDHDLGTDLFEEVLRGYEEEHGPRGWAPSADGLDVVLPDSVRDDPDDGARELDRKLRELVRLRQGLAWQQGRLLATFSTLDLHRALGFLSFGRYCRERAGLGIRRARQLIALDRRLVELPNLAKAYREGEVSWVKVAAVTRVADESSEQAWIQMARSVTFRRLREETAVVAFRLETGQPPDNWNHPAWRPGRFTQPDGVSTSGDVQIDSPWRVGRTPWSSANGGVQRCAPSAGEGEVQTCAGPTTGDGVQMCASSRSRVRFWAPDDVAALWQHALNVCRLVEAGRIEAEPVESTPLEDWECVARMIASFLHTWDISGDPKWGAATRTTTWRCSAPRTTCRGSMPDGCAAEGPARGTCSGNSAPAMAGRRS
ncbi:MAG TPA: DUF222 domain-containing protein [Candidatus Polarisedimenticolia bacterium]|nr:DUF222 domain-containing protein [Candidatus Polarisedimenticolia bacterium]